ncbi:hypothetical protein V2I01_24410 [Micromonospora sp. BRA006-A]|nr:hypothetical protein [Micromonospora sp. BRA006-A]
MTTRAAVRADLGGTGVNGLLVFGFVLGAGGGAALGLLGLALAVLAGAARAGRCCPGCARWACPAGSGADC